MSDSETFLSYMTMLFLSFKFGSFQILLKSISFSLFNIPIYVLISIILPHLFFKYIFFLLFGDI